MNKIITLGLSLVLLIGISSCGEKGCTNPYAPNYNSSATKDDGSCIDLTANVVGLYTGTLQDSIVGDTTASALNQQISITKIDDSHIQVSPANGGNLVPFTASLTGYTSGDLITIPAQTYQGLSINGVLIVVSGGSANGAYLSANRQFASAVVINNGGQIDYEVFQGTHQ